MGLDNGGLSIEAIRRLPGIERIPYLERVRVTYPLWDEIFARMQDCYERQPYASQPPCLMLVAPTGAGKTTLLEEFLKQYPSSWNDAGKVMPIVKASVPARATIKGLVSDILAAMGDPAADRGTLTQMTRRLANYLRDCKSRVLALDEIQHFMDPDRNKIIVILSNWLKKFIKDDAKIGCILVGTQNDAEQLLKANLQLARLFKRPVVLKPFEWDETREQNTITIFRTLLKVLEHQLPFNESSQLSNRARAHRLFLACDGILGHLMELIRHAARIALRRGLEHISDNLLAEAFDLETIGYILRRENPFM